MSDVDRMRGDGVNERDLATLIGRHPRSVDYIVHGPDGLVERGLVEVDEGLIWLTDAGLDAARAIDQLREGQP